MLGELWRGRVGAWEDGGKDMSLLQDCYNMKGKVVMNIIIAFGNIISSN